MSYADATTHFRIWDFRNDVLAYLTRHGISQRAAARSAGLPLNNVMPVLRGDMCPSLRTACALADLCDLSLDTYRTSLTKALDTG